MIDVVLWTVVGFGVVTATSHLSDAARLAALQALTPWTMGPSVPVALAATATGRWAMAIVAGLVSVALLILAWPMVRRATVSDGEPRLRVLYANVKFDQPTPEAAAEALIGLVRRHRVEVLAASEVTVRLSEALESHGVGHLLPHRIGTPVVGPEASVIWTCRPVLAQGDPGPGPTWDADVTVDVDGVGLRIIATHPLPPVGADMRPHWKPGLRSTAARARQSPVATLVVGDLNAARWHRPWRRFVGRDFMSAHEALGRGWTCSWPADRRFPAFVRLDHALYGPGVEPVAVDDVWIPGSDHRGFMLTVAARDRTARPR